MPRTAPDPIIPCLRFFEEQPLDLAQQALSLAKEILRRRHTGESVLTAKGPKIDPPKRKRTPPAQLNDGPLELAKE
jgi:hypothetical protein